MQSLKSRIILWIVRNRHLLKGRLKPEVVDENFSVKEFRDGIDKMSRRMKLPSDVFSEAVDIEGMHGEWIKPESYPDEKILFYIHGGGFISGSCLTHRMHVAKFARGCGLKSLLFDYRLAPEHPFPAGLDDCVTAYKWVLEQGYKPEDIVVGGESAGGTLTLCLLLALNKEGIQLPKAAFSISPITDLRGEAPSFTYNLKKDIAPEGSWEYWSKMYIRDHDVMDPLLSPLFGDYSGMPPIHICVGTHEIHLDDCVNEAKVIEAAGVDVTLSKWKGMVHAFPIMAPMFPEATKALKEICEFVREQLGIDS